MPRKQNGFGNFKVGSVRRPSNDFRVGKVQKAGSYPSENRFGSVVKRSVIEQYDLNSDWVRWRKGMEYYYRSAWLRMYLTDESGQVVLDKDGEKIPTFLDTILYQGTEYEIPIEFTGYRFATSKADSSNHYVVKREVKSEPDLGTITTVYSDKDRVYQLNDGLTVDGPTNFKNRELWVQGTSGSRLLLKMIGERVNDGETEATIKYALNDKQHPAIYVGKTESDALAELKVVVPTTGIMSSKLIQENKGDLQSLIGEVGSLGAYSSERPIENEEFIDGDYEFYIDSNITGNSVSFEILDNPTNLPAPLLDIAKMPKLYKTDIASFRLQARYTFIKAHYQRFFGNKYLTADLVKSELNLISYTILPFTITSVIEKDIGVEITAIPFENSVEAYSTTAGNYLIFTDYSFTKKEPDTYGGLDYHQASKEPDWKRLDTDVNPWQDEVFTSGEPLTVADIWCCSCPSYSHSIIRMPQSLSGDNKHVNNRQYRYPLPTAMGKVDFQNRGLANAAGIVQSWETFAQRTRFKMCKHTIASMFIERLKVVEPSQYPSVDAREQFEEKLAKDIEKVVDELVMSLERSELTTVELVYTLAEGLNLDEVETAAVILGAKF